MALGMANNSLPPVPGLAAGGGVVPEEEEGFRLKLSAFRGGGPKKG